MFSILPIFFRRSVPQSAPVLTANDSVFGRTWTLVASATGNPTPSSFNLTFTVNGSPVSLTPTVVSGTRTWTYTAASSLTATELVWSLVVTNSIGSASANGFRSIAADLAVPTVAAGWDQTTYVSGESVTSADLVRSITFPGSPELVDSALTSTLLVNNSPVALPYTAVTGASMVHRVTGSHPTGAISVDSVARIVQATTTYSVTTEADNTQTVEAPPGETIRYTITNPARLAGTYDVTWPTAGANPVVIKAGSITGTPSSGQVLSEVDAPFGVALSGATTSRQWREDGVSIAGQTGTTYTVNLSEVDAGDALDLLHSITDANGTTTSDTNNLTVVSTASLTITGGRTDGLLIDYTGTLTITGRTDGLLVDVT